MLLKQQTLSRKIAAVSREKSELDKAKTSMRWHVAIVWMLLARLWLVPSDTSSITLSVGFSSPMISLGKKIRAIFSKLFQAPRKIGRKKSVRNARLNHSTTHFRPIFRAIFARMEWAWAPVLFVCFPFASKNGGGLWNREKLVSRQKNYISTRVCSSSVYWYGLFMPRGYFADSISPPVL